MRHPFQCQLFRDMIKQRAHPNQIKLFFQVDFGQIFFGKYGLDIKL